MSDHLRRLAIGELARIVTGGTPSSSSPEAWGNHIPFITPSDQQADSRDAKPSRWLSTLGAESMSRMVVPALSTQITCIGSTIGKLSRAQAACVTNQQINSLVARDGICDPGFLYYRTKLWAPELASLASGSATPIVNKSVLARVELTVPLLPTQRAIAEVLGALDDKIAANQRVADSADTLATALVAREESEPTQLARVAEVVMGSSPRGESMNEEGEGTEFFQGVRDFGIRVPVRRVSTTEPTRIAASGDVLLSVRAPVGRVNRADRTMCVGRGLAAVRSDFPNVLFHVLRNAPMWESFNGEGTVFGSISGKDLRGVALAWPSPSRLALVEQTLKPIEARIDQAVAESARLAELRDTLLPHLMSGRLTVREAEKQVEEVL